MYGMCGVYGCMVCMVCTVGTVGVIYIYVCMYILLASSPTNLSGVNPGFSRDHAQNPGLVTAVGKPAKSTMRSCLKLPRSLRALRVWRYWLKGESNDWLKYTEPNLERKGCNCSLPLGGVLWEGTR